jgi:hypothetical protein
VYGNLKSSSSNDHSSRGVEEVLHTEVQNAMSAAASASNWVEHTGTVLNSRKLIVKFRFEWKQKIINIGFYTR